MLVSHSPFGSRGPREIVIVPNGATNQDLELSPEFGRLTDRLASISRYVSYDQRGAGLSDPVALNELPTLEGWMKDLHAVVLAAALSKSVLIAHAAAGQVALLSRCPATYSRTDRCPSGTGKVLRAMIPSVTVDEAHLRYLARMERQSLSPAAVAIFRRNYDTDVRAVLPLVSAPTLVVHTTDNRVVPAAHGRYLAAHIPHARLVELPGADHDPFLTGQAELLGEEIEEFLTGTRAAVAPSRMLTTLLFTDIVSSTDRVVAIGDRAWRALLDRHDDAVRHQLARFSGHEARLTGDGVLATFDGPALAIRCGRAIRDASRQLGIDVREGIHTGESNDAVPNCRRRRSPRSAHLRRRTIRRTARLAPARRPGRRSGIRFEDRGPHDLKGIPQQWQLFAVEA